MSETRLRVGGSGNHRKAKKERKRGQASTAEEQAEAAKEQAEATERRNRKLYDTGHPLSDGATAVVAAGKQGVSDANAALNTVRKAATTARREVQSLLAEQAYYRSHPFYFSHLRYPIQTAETDGDGKFVIQLPLNGKFIIAAQAERSVGNETESYYWLEPVSLDGQREGVQNLSNSNVMLIPSNWKRYPTALLYAVKYSEIIADNLSKAGWSWGCVSAIDSGGHTIWIAETHIGATEIVLLRVRMKC